MYVWESLNFVLPTDLKVLHAGSVDEFRRTAFRNSDSPTSRRVDSAGNVHVCSIRRTLVTSMVSSFGSDSESNCLSSGILLKIHYSSTNFVGLLSV